MKKKLTEQTKELFKNNKFKEGLHVTTTMNFGMVFLLSVLNAFSSVAHFILFPVAILTTVFETLFFIAEPNKDRKKKINAIVSILTTTGLIVGIVALFLASALSAAPGLYILSVTLGLRSLYELFMAGKHWMLFMKNRKINPTVARQYRNEAIEYTMNFICYVFSAAGLGAMAATDNSSFAALGVVSGVIGTSYAVYKGYQAHKKHKLERMQNAMATQNVTNNRYLYEALQQKKPLPQASVNVMIQEIENKLDQEFTGVEELNDIDESFFKTRSLR